MTSLYLNKRFITNDKESTAYFLRIQAVPSFSVFPIPQDGKPFILQEKVQQKVIFFWLQLARSSAEARKYQYSIQLVHPQIGRYQYEGH